VSVTRPARGHRGLRRPCSAALPAACRHTLTTRALTRKVNAAERYCFGGVWAKLALTRGPMAKAAAFNILEKQASAVLTLCLCCVCPHCVPSWALMAQHCPGLCSKMGASNTAAGQCAGWECSHSCARSGHTWRRGACRQESVLSGAVRWMAAARGPGGAQQGIEALTRPRLLCTSWKASATGAATASAQMCAGS